MTLSVLIFCELLFSFYVCHFDFYVVMTSIFSTYQRKYAISSRSMAIVILLSTRPNTVLNILIESHHCKRHTRERTREFHLHSLSIHITSQPKHDFTENFKLLQNDNETGRISSHPLLISYKRDKNIRNFLV